MKPTIYFLIILTLLTSCSCPPASEITSGRANQRWEKRHKWGKRTVRVMWIRKTGPFYKVRFENKKETFNEDFDKLPAWCIEGNWIPLDSIKIAAL